MYFHLCMSFVWPALVVPALLWWKQSIIFVILVSLYANFATDSGAYRALRAELEAEKGNGDVDSP